MNVQSKIAVSLILAAVAGWMLWKFSQRKLSAGQVLFWLILMGGAEVLALFPLFVHHLSALWGNLIPVSWITFVGMVSLILYLIHQSIEINRLRSQVTTLAREIALVEEQTRNPRANSGHGQ